MEEPGNGQVATASPAEQVPALAPELPRIQTSSGASALDAVSLINSLLSTTTPTSIPGDLPDVSLEQLQQLLPLTIPPLPVSKSTKVTPPPPPQIPPLGVVASQPSVLVTSLPTEQQQPPPPTSTSNSNDVVLPPPPPSPPATTQPPPEAVEVAKDPAPTPPPPPSAPPAAAAAVTPPLDSSPPVLSSPIPPLSSLAQARVSPPSLHANEEMLSEDSEEEEMDAMDTPTTSNNTSSVVSGPALSSASLAPPTISSAPASVRSESVSPYAECDDESFADFVAKEASTNALGEDHSHSPTPNPAHSSQQSVASGSDIHALLNHIHRQSPSAFEGPSALISQFGVTASCPPTPVQLPEGAIPAPLDMTAKNFPKRSKYAHRAAISAMHPYNRTRGGGPSVAKTLDLLKAVLQPSFNQELKRLCDDYLQIFTLAAGNIRENTRDNVPEATLRVLVHKMMEEAQQGYVHGKWEFPSGKLPRNEKVCDAKCTPMASKKVKAERNDTKYGPPKRARKPPTERQEKSTGWRWGMDKKRLDPIKWEPEKLSCEIDFVLGVNVNKALGHAANRGKVYYLHPELFKYACDGDDKTWLYENKHLPVHGGKAFLMIFDEVESLVKTDDFYKDSNDVWLAVKKLQKFHVPQFMVDKMKYFMQSVQGYFAQEAKDGSSGNSSKS